MEDTINGINRIPAIASRYWKQILVWNALVLTTAIIGFVAGPRTYLATAKFILPRSTAQFNANLGTLGSVSDGDNSEPTDVQNQISILQSDMLISKVLETDPDRDKFPKLEQYSRLFLIKPEDKATVFKLSVQGPNAKLAMNRATSLVRAYQERLNELRSEDKSSRTQFGRQEFENAEKRLQQAQSALTQFKQSSGLVSSDAQVQGLVSTINSLMTQQAQVQNLTNTSADRVKTISSQLGLAPNQTVKTMKLSDNQDFQAVRKQLSDVNAALTLAKANYQDNHPQILELVSQQNKLESQYQRYVQQAAEGLQIDPSSSGSGGRANLMLQLVEANNDAITQKQQAEDLGRKIEALNNKLKTLPSQLATLQELQRHYEVAEGVYKGLWAQGKQGNIDVYNAFPNVQVLDPPRVIAKSYFLLILFNALLASGIGTVGLTLWLERQNPVLTPKDLHITRIPTLATIPRTKLTTNEWESTSISKIVFQQLASLVNLQNIENRRLMVTSAIEGEGKTTIIIGLANALVDLGYRVLLVDGDFRKAELSQRVGCVKDWSFCEELWRYLEEGFSTDLRAENTLFRSLIEQALINIHPNLDLIPTLPQRGKIINLIRQGRFEKTLDTASTIREYDYVLVDSAPVSLTSETALMAGISENVVFVVRPNISRRDAFLHSIEQLTQHKAKILGWAINDVGTTKGYRQYGAEVSPQTNTEQGIHHSNIL